MPSTRPRCAVCDRPQPACLCRWVTPIRQSLPLLVLQHPAEQRHAKNSLTLLRLSLADCQVQVGEHFEETALRRWLGQGSALLHPLPAGQQAQPLGITELKQWVLLDGTWRQSHKMLRDHPLLQALPRLTLPDRAPDSAWGSTPDHAPERQTGSAFGRAAESPPAASAYRIRTAPQPHLLSTLEAACQALALIDNNPASSAPLLQAFEGWVDSVLQRGARKLHRKRSENGES